MAPRVFRRNFSPELLNWPSRFWAGVPKCLKTLYDGGRRRANSETALANYDGTVATIVRPR